MSTRTVSNALSKVLLELTANTPSSKYGHGNARRKTGPKGTTEKSNSKRGSSILGLKDEIHLVAIGLRSACLIDSIQLTLGECALLSELFASDPNLAHLVLLHESTTSQTFILHRVLLRSRLQIFTRIGGIQTRPPAGCGTVQKEYERPMIDGERSEGVEAVVECEAEGWSTREPMWVNVGTGRHVKTTPRAVIRALAILRNALGPHNVDPGPSNHRIGGLLDTLLDADKPTTPATHPTTEPGSMRTDLLIVRLVPESEREGMICVTAWLLEYGVGYFMPSQAEERETATAESTESNPTMISTQARGDGTAMDGDALLLVRVWLRLSTGLSTSRGIDSREETMGKDFRRRKGENATGTSGRLVMSFSLPAALARRSEVEEDDFLKPELGTSDDDESINVDHMLAGLEERFADRLRRIQARDHDAEQTGVSGSMTGQEEDWAHWRAEVEVTRVVLDRVAL